MDQKKLAVIHIVKKELGLSDEEYRDILEKHAGVRSAKDLDEQGFRKLMHYFVRSRHYRSSRDVITLRQKMYIKHLVVEAGWSMTHFANFMKKYYRKSSLEAFSKKEASRLIESMKNIIKHQDSTTGCQLPPLFLVCEKMPLKCIRCSGRKKVNTAMKLENVITQDLTPGVN